MSDLPEAAPNPCEPDLDENGGDLAHIRAMLDLTPAKRLTCSARFAAALQVLRARNDATYGVSIRSTVTTAL